MGLRLLVFTTWCT